MTDSADRFCIIGAGSSGLAALRRLLAKGIPCECLEREDDLGGNWRYGNSASSVYASTHMISSKPLTQYLDFPIPDEYPDYLHHRQVWSYLDAYARHYGLRDHIRFRHVVERLTPMGEDHSDAAGWEVRFVGGETRRYRGIVIANGHNWDPRFPAYPGNFSGETTHSSRYKTPDAFVGRRVLIVGGGNSGCDLACEAAIHADAAYWSTRRAYHILPKFFRGRPIDQCGELLLRSRFPLWLRRTIASATARLVLGPPRRAGLPIPDHPLFATHPIINSQLHHHLGHGKLIAYPDIAQLNGERVKFIDGREIEVDLIVWATGYRVTIPFIDPRYLNWQDEAPQLYLNIFHPTRDDIFCVGLIQPDSGQFGLVDCQSEAIASYIHAVQSNAPQAAWFQKKKGEISPSLGGGIRYIKTPRHRLEVEHSSYKKRLQSLARRLETRHGLT